MVNCRHGYHADVIAQALGYRGYRADYRETLMFTFSDLEDRIAIVTGGATGIGEAFVRAFVEQSAIVHFCDINKDAGRQLADELGEQAVFTPLDVTREDEVRAWIQAAGAVNGQIYALVNNVAHDQRIPFDDVSMDDWDRLIAVNLRAAFVCIQEAVKFMGGNKGGSIINLGSCAFHTGQPNHLSVYISAKGGQLGVTRELARELGPRNIRVNLLSPGWTMTDRQLRDHVTDETQQFLKEVQCLGEPLMPAEIANVALFLASDASRAITGQNILADKGWAHH